MKNYIITPIICLALLLGSCEGLVEGINDNPNKITADEIEAQLFLTGAQLSNIQAQLGHLNRVSGMWSGQLTGFASLYSNIYGYDISTAESVGTWSAVYIGTVTNLRHIRNVVPDNKLLVGIAKIIEAHAVGTAASIFGDVPYSEINNSDIANPAFDSQVDVFNDLILLLDGAITDLATEGGRTLGEDIYYNGNATAWIEAANTLKARYYLQMKDYNNAYSSAQGGISSAANSMQYFPTGDPSVAADDKNLFWTILEGARAGDIGTGNSFLMQSLDPGNGTSRNHAKTDETARFNYYTIDEGSGGANTGIVSALEPQRMVTYEENQLILAEAGARTVDFATGLGHLNTFRQFLDGGGSLNSNFSSDPYTYADFVTTDFDALGIENLDGINPDRALLREIIEERYVSGFGTYMPFNDARRLRKDDSDIAVAIPFNNGTATAHPERLPYSDDELNANTSAPDEDPGIFVKTVVNQ